MNEVIANVIVDLLDHGSIVGILIAAFIYRDRQGEIDRKRSDEKYDKLFAIMEKLIDEINRGQR